jgi:hypothetical protein
MGYLLRGLITALMLVWEPVDGTLGFGIIVVGAFYRIFSAVFVGSTVPFLGLLTALSGSITPP